MAKTFIRQAGPYKIERENGIWFVNGAERKIVAIFSTPRLIGGRKLVAMLDTGEFGANGKPNQIGITEEESMIAQQDVSLGAAALERKRQERDFDNRNNEGGEGYNPFRQG